MIIPLSDQLRIEGTENSWQLQRPRKDVKTPDRWEPFKYYATLRAALSEAAHREIRTDPAVGVDECLRAAERVVAKYAQIFDQAVKDG